MQTVMITFFLTLFLSSWPPTFTEASVLLFIPYVSPCLFLVRPHLGLIVFYRQGASLCLAAEGREQ